MNLTDDFLYVILFLVIIAFNLIKKLNKAQTIPASKPSVPKSDFDRETGMKTSTTTPASLKKTTAKNLESRETHTFPTEVQKTKKQMMPVISEKESTKEISFNDVNDARRAFIYSEIWNRKYC